MIYDLSYILSGNLSDTEVAEKQKEKSTFLKGLDLKMLHDEAQGNKKLPYQIKNVKFGHFFRFVFESAGNVMNKIEKTFSLDTDIIKYFATKRTSWNPEKNRVWRTEGSERAATERKDKPVMPLSAPVVISGKPMTDEELNEKIDKILESPII